MVLHFRSTSLILIAFVLVGVDVLIYYVARKFVNLGNGLLAYAKSCLVAETSLFSCFSRASRIPLATSPVPNGFVMYSHEFDKLEVSSKQFFELLLFFCS